MNAISGRNWIKAILAICGCNAAFQPRHQNYHIKHELATFTDKLLADESATPNIHQSTELHNSCALQASRQVNSSKAASHSSNNL